MGDGLSERDRQLIDAAVEKGKVKKIPQGASAYPSYVFDHAKNRLISEDQDKADGMNGWKGHRERSKQAKKKRMELLTHLQAGVDLEEAAKLIGRAYSTAHQYMMILHREGHDVALAKAPVSVDDPLVFLSVSRFFCGNVEELAQSLGSTRSRMVKILRDTDKYDHLDQIKVNLARNRKRKAAKMSDDEVKRKTATELFKKGYGYEDVAVILGIEVGLSREIMLTMKEKGPPPK